MAEINQSIGATGVVSNECKMVVKQYGDQIVEMLLDQVKNLTVELAHFSESLVTNALSGFHGHATLLEGVLRFLTALFCYR